MAGTYYPPVGFHFKVKFSVKDATDNDARFMEVSGLSQTMDTETLKEGGNNLFSWKLPTRGNFGKLVLKRGMNLDSGILKWIQQALDDQKYEPAQVTVSLLGYDVADQSKSQSEKQAPKAIARWDFFKAYPVKWDFSTLDAKKNDIVVETLELAYAYFKKS